MSALNAIPFCHDVWKLVISTVPLEPSLTFFLAQSSRPSLAVISSSDTSLIAKRRISVHTIPRMNWRSSSRTFSAEYWFLMPIDATNELMYLIGRLRFSTFWILLTCHATPHAHANPHVSSRRAHLPPSASQDRV